MTRFILAVIFLATIAGNAGNASAYTPVIACESHGTGVTRITIATFADDVLEDETGTADLLSFMVGTDGPTGVYLMRGDVWTVTFPDDTPEDAIPVHGLIAFLPARPDNAIGVYRGATCEEVIAAVAVNVATMRGR